MCHLFKNTESPGEFLQVLHLHRAKRFHQQTGGRCLKKQFQIGHIVRCSFRVIGDGHKLENSIVGGLHNRQRAQYSILDDNRPVEDGTPLPGLNKKKVSLAGYTELRIKLSEAAGILKALISQALHQPQDCLPVLFIC